MNLKKNLGLVAASAIIGIALVSGGTYSYFSDSEVTMNTFASGTLDLTIEPTEIVNLENLKPGDTITRTFELHNSGTLDIQKVFLETYYDVIDAEKDNTENFGKHILVEFLYNVDQVNEVIYETTLFDLQTMTPEAVSEEIFLPIIGEEGLQAGTSDDFLVKFAFVDNGGDQNQFQGDAISLKWTFKAEQGLGEEK